MGAGFDGFDGFDHLDRFLVARTSRVETAQQHFADADEDPADDGQVDAGNVGERRDRLLRRAWRCYSETSMTASASARTAATWDSAEAGTS